MTIPSETNRSGPYACNGVTKDFPFGFKVYDAAHIRVILTAPDGLETDLTLGTDYSVSGAGTDGGGAVTTVATYASGYQVTLILSVPFVQETDLENQGAYYAETIERAFDLLTQMSLQLKELIARAVVLPVTSSVSVDTLTNAVLALAAIQSQLLELVSISDDIETVAGIADEVVAAEGHANTAATAAGVSTAAAASAAASAAAAATWDPTAYSTTAQIEAMLAAYVPTTRTIASGTGILINGGASAQLSGTVTISLDLSAKALTQATWTAGVSTVEAPISPAKLAAVFAALNSGLVLTKSYVSAEQALVAGGLTTLAHGLGVSPKIVIVKLVCKTAENGYAVGDVIIYSSAFASGSAQGVAIRIDATNIKIRIGNYSANPILILTEAGALATSQPANWRMIVEAYA